MHHRAFPVVVALGILVVPLAVGAQQPPKMYRIGYLAPGPAGCPLTAPTRAFLQGLGDASYIEGRDVILDRRCFPTNDMVGKVLDDVLNATPNILVAAGTPAALAMRDRALAIPIVFADVADPVGSRLVQSLARPGSNMTGLANLTLDLNAKRVQILKEALPGVRLIATLGTPEDPALGLATEQFRGEIEQVGSMLSLQVRHFTVRTAADLPSAFHAMKKDGVQALIVQHTGALFWTERAQIADLATKHQLPGMYPFRGQVEAGGLISYTADQAEIYRKAAGYVVKILKGAKPGDLPVEQPTKFELVINLKTAKALGLTIPQSLLLRAEHVIE